MERLTDDRFLKDGFYQPKSKDEEKEIRSIGNDLTFEKLYRHCAEVEKQNAELQKQVDKLKKRLHWIWAIGVDYDGCSKAESLKGLIDEMVELTQIESKDLDEYFTYNTTQGGKMNILSIVRKIERKDVTKEIYQEIDKSDILVVETQEYGEIEVVPMERLKEIIKRKGVEVE